MSNEDEGKGFQRSLNEKFVLGMNIQECILEGHHTELYMCP